MILGVLQARMSSTRLPGKVLKQVLGKPLLELQIERLRRSCRLEKLVLATSDRPEDSPIEELCKKLSVTCFRGSLEDVLDRVYRAALVYSPTAILRLTADCPLADPTLIDKLVRFFELGNYDYASNTLDRTWPDGLDAEITRFETLHAAWTDASSAHDREHVTPYIYLHPERFSLGSLTQDTDYSHLRWTVDDPIDFQLIEQIYAALYPSSANFTTQDVLRLLESRPDLKVLNAAWVRTRGTAS